MAVRLGIATRLNPERTLKTLIPRFSYYLAAIFLIIYTGALICITVSAMNPLIKLLVSLLIILHGVIMARRYVLFSDQKSIIKINYSSHSWQLFLKSGMIIDVTVLPHSIVTRYLIILNFKTLLTHKKFTLLLLPDSLLFRDLRQLRMKLNFDLD